MLTINVAAMHEPSQQAYKAAENKEKSVVGTCEGLSMGGFVCLGGTHSLFTFVTHTCALATCKQTTNFVYLYRNNHKRTKSNNHAGFQTFSFKQSVFF